jgi:aldose 1-epimerase
MLTLQAGEASLVLAPEFGGAIVGWTRGATAIMRHASAEGVLRGDVRELAAFPLVPYSNRIAQARFRFDDRDYAVARNFGDHPHSIHGIGWQRAWQVKAVAADAATLALTHAGDADGWPFGFHAEQHFTLREDALHIALSIENRHPNRAPVGLGIHPYFPRAGTPELRFAAQGVWRNTPDQLPVERVAVPAEWEHRGGRTVGSVVLDNCFTGWDGNARMTWPDRSLTMTASAVFDHVVVYTPAGQDFFCVEPVSHMTDAINRGGMRVLDAGEAFGGTIALQLS